MSENPFAQSVLEKFAYLLTDYGFRVKEVIGGPWEGMGNAGLIMTSASTEIEIVKDRSQVLIRLRPVTHPASEWSELRHAVHALSPDLEPIYLFADEEWKDTVVPDDVQVKHLATLVRNHCQPMLRGEFPTPAEIKQAYLRDFSPK